MTGFKYTDDRRWIETSDVSKKRVSLFLKICYVVIMTAGGLGEWKTVNAAFGGKPKAVTVGVIAIAIAYCFIAADTVKFKKVFKPYMMYVMLIALILIWSFVIWIFNFADPSSISRGGEKMLYQFISVTIASSSVVLFGLESIDLFFISMCIANTLIMILEMRNFGIGASLNSLFHNIISFGDAVGFARSIEIHELTFLFGQFTIYYGLFYPVDKKEDKKKKYIFLALAVFFFLAGLKRIAVVSLVIALIVGFVFSKLRNPVGAICFVGILFFVLYYGFLYIVRDGTFARIMNKIGVNMMGRSYIWSLANDYYELSPAFMGLGFEAVDRISKIWYQEGLIQVSFMFHNDILKAFVELGFPGFTIWSAIQYIVYPIWFSKKYSPKVAMCYMTLLVYMSFTYMTDNTAFYYWCTMGLRMIPLAFIFSVKARESKEKWRPISKEEYNERLYSELSAQYESDSL